MHRHAICCGRLWLALLVVAALSLSGCGDKGPAQYPVTGKVTLPGGSPAGCAVVFVERTTGTAGTGQVQADGSYAVKCQGKDGLPSGSYKVSVSPPAKDMSDAEYETYMNASAEEQAKMNAERAEAEKAVPAKYRDAKTSGLTCDVKDGPQTFDITIEADK